MRVAILQPGYLPWLGFFEQMHRADVFVVYDDVQYDKHGWRNRNRIKTPGGIQWLTVPVLTKGQDKPLVNEVKIDNSTDWRKKHVRGIVQNYSKAPYFKRYERLFEEAYSKEYEKLIDVDMCFIRLLCKEFGLEKKIVMSSEIKPEGDRIERLIDICRKLGADTFYEGAAGRDYMSPSEFKSQGITLEFQDYNHPVYPQLHGEFVPLLSAIDLLFNCGDSSLDILAGGKKAER